MKRTLLRDAQVITMAPTRPDAECVDILVEDDYIAQIGNHLVTDDAEIVDLAGIGAAFARHLATEGCDVLLVARRAERLEELATQIHQQHGVRAEVFASDLTDPAAPAAIITRATELGLPIDVLINNAGLSASAKF